MELLDMTGWTWGVIGVVLITLEVFAPGIAFLWLGLAALVLALVLFVLPAITWPVQLVIFAVLAVVAVFLGRRYVKLNPVGTADAVLNRRGEQYVGRVFTLVTPIENGRGKLRVDDTTWVVEGPDLPAGTAVRVTALHNVILVVERA